MHPLHLKADALRFSRDTQERRHIQIPRLPPKLHPGTDGEDINTEASGNHWYEKSWQATAYSVP